MAGTSAKRCRRRRRRGNPLMIIGGLLIAAAVLLTSLNFTENRAAGEAAGDALEQLLLAERDMRDEARRAAKEAAENEASSTSESSGGITLDPVYLDPPDTADGNIPVVDIDGYDYMGILQIPALDLTLPVIADWSYPALQIAPCRYEGSVDGHLVLSGHNFESHFGRLYDLEIGDEVRFIDLAGGITSYAVAETEVLEATAIEEMVTGGWDLTLFTCTLSGQTRFTVRAALAGSGT